MTIMSIVRIHLRAAVLALCLPWAGMSHAGCELHFSSPQLDLGTIVAGKAAKADAGSYRQFGSPRSVMLLVACDADRSALRLRVLNVASRQYEPKLLQWDPAQPAGALRLRFVRALANDIPVQLVVDGKALVAPLDIDRNAIVLSFDLTPVRSRARRFELELQVTGLVADAFVPVGATAFGANPLVELLEP